MTSGSGSGTEYGLSWADHLLGGDSFVRVAGLFGALAVSLGAYGEHVLKSKVTKEFYQVFQTANQYHFYHTLALLCTPFVAQPFLFAVMMICGMLLFCGSCYVYAITQNEAVVKVTPWGGMLLILAWLSAALP